MTFITYPLSQDHCLHEAHKIAQEINNKKYIEETKPKIHVIKNYEKGSEENEAVMRYDRGENL